MKTQVVREPKNIGPGAHLSALVLHEQLALKRLKELEARHEQEAEPAAIASGAVVVVTHAKPKSGLRWLWRAPLIVLSAMFRRTELRREVAPGQAPVLFHEVERARNLRALAMM